MSSEAMLNLNQLADEILRRKTLRADAKCYLCCDPASVTFIGPGGFPIPCCSWCHWRWKR